MFRVYSSKTIFCHIPYALSQQRVTFSYIMYQATLRVLCNTFCNILFFSQPFSFIDKCILICWLIFVNCYIVLSKLFAAYIFVQKKRLRKTDAKFHIMDSGTEYTEQSSMAIICPQSGSRLSHPPLLRFRRHLS